MDNVGFSTKKTNGKRKNCKCCFHQKYRTLLPSIAINTLYNPLVTI